jgi:hypothetical protein
MKNPHKTPSLDSNNHPPNYFDPAAVPGDMQGVNLSPAEGVVIDWEEIIDVPPPRVSQIVAVLFVEGSKRLPRLTG